MARLGTSNSSPKRQKLSNLNRRVTSRISNCYITCRETRFCQTDPPNNAEVRGVNGGKVVNVIFKDQTCLTNNTFNIFFCVMFVDIDNKLSFRIGSNPACPTPPAPEWINTLSPRFNWPTNDHSINAVMYTTGMVAASIND
ncbi:hypothetical protein BLOT_015647 [Blomia tropicalis]|nr:hypothetical protein BLOT_015647 [Blomia tropicalis]